MALETLETLPEARRLWYASSAHEAAIGAGRRPALPSCAGPAVGRGSRVNETPRPEPALERRMDSLGLPVLPPLIALVELAALIGLIVLVDWATPDIDLTDLKPNPLWLPVLLLSLQYGTVSGLMAALFAVASMAPKRLIWLTVAFPFLGFWLLWGGTIWGPMGAATGFVILALVFRASQARLGPVVGAGAGIVAAAVWWLVVQSTVTGALQAAMPFGLVHVESDVFGGFLLSFVIGVTAISASLPMGILLALGRRSDMLLIKTLSVGFIEFIRGVPLITMLFTASLLLQYFLPPQTQFDLILRVIILVTLFAAAYIAWCTLFGLIVWLRYRRLQVTK